MTRHRVYVAGAYSADNVITVLDNMRRGMRACTQLMLWGYAPFCPWLDYQLHFYLRDDNNEQLVLDDYYEYSMAWLEVSEVLCVLPNSEHSKGTQREIARARVLDIPVLDGIGEVLVYFRGIDGDYE